MRKMLIVMVILLLAMPAFGQVTVDAPELPERVDVTFQYENPDATDVFMIGGFNGWTENDEDYRMELVDGLWTFTMNVRSNAQITYKFFVDGEYITDPNAPATTDDGFGGQNGVVQVANLLGGAPADGGGFVFGKFTEIYSDATFLTEELEGDDRGYAADKWELKAKSYWKLTADVLPWLETYIELKVFDGSITLFEQAADAELTDGDPVVPLSDGFANLGSALFNPFNALNNGENPELGHFRATATTPYVNFNTGYKWTKGTGHDSIMYRTSHADESDANDGFLEMSLGDELTSLGDMGTVDATLALTKRTGRHGVYSWVTLNLMEDFVVDAAWNALMTSSDDLKDFFDDTKHMTTIGASADLMDGMLNVRGQYLLNFGETYDVDADAMAFAGGFTVTPGIMDLKLDVDARWGGSNTDIFLGANDGDDDDYLRLREGMFVSKVNVELQPADIVKLGHNYTLETDNEFEGDALNKFNPWVNLFLSEVAPVNAQLDLSANMEYQEEFDLEDVKATLTLRELAPQLDRALVEYIYHHDPDAEDYNDEIRAQVRLTDLAEIMPTATVDAAYRGAAKEATLVGRMNFVNRLGADIGFVLRDTDLNIPFGFALGGRWTMPEELRDGQFFAAYTFDFDPYASEDIHTIEFDDGFVDTTGGAGQSKFRLGVRWDF
ncbi:glycogen-binding domain-containing protein [Spirochaeta africana]|uniref:Putative carbohydrate binding protein n=1 Tax=Spirochaeta africana (strain ATCC 700263 / DSM 8902 / Z-7692) TaxID=889378 RepID=H9ULJ9_SPIAZ|nr:glycogen-binding domain-containing protein [Spirochaeta africana]AFG38392.1 putative carbohydrate binding protein [Spirochaeta africana DSM 8902]